MWYNTLMGMRYTGPEGAAFLAAAVAIAVWAWRVLRRGYPGRAGLLFLLATGFLLFAVGVALDYLIRHLAAA